MVANQQDSQEGWPENQIKEELEPLAPKMTSEKNAEYLGGKPSPNARVRRGRFSRR